jgi:hypothetical protein
VDGATAWVEMDPAGHRESYCIWILKPQTTFDSPQTPRPGRAFSTRESNRVRRRRTCPIEQSGTGQLKQNTRTDAIAGLHITPG